MDKKRGLIVRPTHEHQIILLCNNFKIINNIKFIWFWQNWKFDSNTDSGEIDFLGMAAMPSLSNDSLTVSTLACHAADPGSNPARAMIFSINNWNFIYLAAW